MNTRIAGRLLFCLLALSALLPAAGTAGKALAEEARNIASECTYKVSKGGGGTKALCDGNYDYCWESPKAWEPWVEVTLPEGETCSGVQIKWAFINKYWALEVEKNGEWVQVDGYSPDIQNTWTPLDNVKKFRIIAHNRWEDVRKINELEVYSAGERPASVQVWQPTVEKADLLVVVAHPDDEFVFLGAVIPYYIAQGRKVLVCYITESTVGRRTELLDGLWAVGQRTYPLMGKFYDRYTMSMDVAYDKIGKNKVRSYMIEVFRRYRPEVVVTHDIHGEYGHGVHKVCADIVINALEKSGNKKYEPESAKEYGTWEVPKCYIHLYEKNRVVFDWKAMTLDAFGGKTAFEVADAGWQCHLSQVAMGKYEVYVDGPYDSQVFGLYRSKVGPDKEHNDFFENMPDPEPTPTPEPQDSDFLTVEDE